MIPISTLTIPPQLSSSEGNTRGQRDGQGGCHTRVRGQCADLSLLCQHGWRIGLKDFLCLDCNLCKGQEVGGS